MSTVQENRTATGVIRTTADVAGPLCIQTLDAETLQPIWTTLDERIEMPIGERYRTLFEDAVGAFPDRSLVIVRVPLDDWYDETTVRMAIEDKLAA